MPGAVVKIFFAALPFVVFELLGVLAGCFRFLDEFDEEFPSSGLAEKDEVPGIDSLAEGVEVAPFTAVRLFRVLDEVVFSPSGLEPLTVLFGATPLERLDDFDPGLATSRSMSMSRSSA